MWQKHVSMLAFILAAAFLVTDEEEVLSVNGELLIINY